MAEAIGAGEVPAESANEPAILIDLSAVDLSLDGLLGIYRQFQVSLRYIRLVGADHNDGRPSIHAETLQEQVGSRLLTPMIDSLGGQAARLLIDDELSHEHQEVGRQIPLRGRQPLTVNRI